MLKKVVLLGVVLCSALLLPAQISKPDAICTAAQTEEVGRTRVIWRLGQLPYILSAPMEAESITEERAEAADAFQINVFPNPSSEQISIDFAFDQTDPVRIRLVDNQGNLVLDRIEPLPVGVQEFDISRLTSGIYYLSITAGEELLAQSKIIKSD